MRIGAVGSDKESSPWEVYENYGKTAAAGQPVGKQKDLTAGETQESSETKSVNDTQGCETCKNRKYQDGSNDPGVSFKTPTALTPNQAAGAVRGHEMEHVTREQSKARRESREVVSQQVTYRNGVCSECGSVYLAGGTTKTTTRAQEENSDLGKQPGSSGFQMTV